MVPEISIAVVIELLPKEPGFSSLAVKVTLPEALSTPETVSEPRTGTSLASLVPAKACILPAMVMLGAFKVTSPALPLDTVVTLSVTAGELSWRVLI